MIEDYFFFLRLEVFFFLMKQKPIVTEQALNFVSFDIGCGSGNRAAQWATNDKLTHVFCFDPLAECIEQATLKSQDKSIVGRMHPVCAAVTAGANATTTLLHIANDISSCSLLPFNVVTTKWKYPPGKTPFRNIATRNVPIIRMDTFMSDRRIARVQFCRIETQGTPIDAVKSFGQRIKDVMEFAIKVHVVDFDVYIGQEKKGDLLAYMNENGFDVHGLQRHSQDQEEIIWFVNRKYAKQSLKHLDFRLS